MKELDREYALVVLSGGQDSTTCLGWALSRYKKVFCLTFDYGQRHNKEITAAMDVVDHFESTLNRLIPHEVLELPGNFFDGDSPLTNPNKELERYTDHSSMEKIIGDRVELTFVPMRNATFLTLAANRAAVHGCGTIITGVCQGDNANYPDCREPFIWAMEHGINQALGLMKNEAGKRMTIKCPLMHLSKAESIDFALQFPETYAALAWSHTAYDGSYPPNGNDHASVLRAYGFEKANKPDPLILRAWHEGRIPRPSTANYEDGIVKPLYDEMKGRWA